MNPLAATLPPNSSGISTTEFLVVLACMLILMVAGLAGLVRYQSRHVRAPGIAGRLAELILSKEPRQKVLLLRYLVGAANSVAGVAALNYGVSEGVIDAQSCGILTTVTLSLVVGFYVAMRSGFNQRFKDAALAGPQMLCAELLLAWGYVLGGPGRQVALLLLFVFLMFHMFRSTSRQLILMCAIAAPIFGAAMFHVGRMEQHLIAYSGKLQLVYFCVMVFVLVSMCLLMSELNRLRATSAKRKSELAEALTRIQDLATRDELTGLFNRRHMLELLNTEKHRSIRTDRRFCIALVDVDHFKRVNDTHGHGVGDEVLASVASVISSGLRETDVVARWGGEEFLIMFTDTDTPTAEFVMSRMQMMLSATTTTQSVPDLHVTFSAGLTHYEPEEMLTRTIDRADRALYLAKAGGRNRVVRLDPSAGGDHPVGPGATSRPTAMPSVALEDRHAFDMGGMREHVHRPA